MRICIVKRLLYMVTSVGHVADPSHRPVAEPGGGFATTPKQVASGQDIVFACVGNDSDLREVTLGDAGAFAGMGGGAVRAAWPPA